MSLYQLEKEGDVDTLLDRLKLSDSASIRRRAAEILGDVVTEEPHAVDGLIRTARSDDDPAVRGAAIDALDAIGTDAIERLITEMADVDADGADWVRARAFVGALSADRPALRMAAANALRRLGDPGALPALVETLEDPNPRVRSRTARACGAVGDDRATPALAARLDDPEGRVRRAAADALAAVGTDRALAPLVDAVSDTNEGVRYAAVTALGSYGRAAAIDPLIAAIGDDSEVIRRAAVYSIIELLATAPADGSHRLRESVLDRFDAADRSVVEPLVELIEESDQARERRNAVWLAGRVTGESGRQAVVDALVGALDAAEETTARFAATSLVELGGEEVEAACLDVLESADRSTPARSKAAFVLGTVGGERARERLETVLDRSDDEAVRKQAFSALSKLGGRR